MERMWDQRRSAETRAPLTSRLPNMESLRVRYDRWKMSADRPLCTQVQRQQQSAHGITGSSIIKTVSLVYLSGCPPGARVAGASRNFSHCMSKQLGCTPLQGCIQDDCGCMPIDCPSSEAKPIDLVEATNGQANLANDLGCTPKCPQTCLIRPSVLYSFHPGCKSLYTLANASNTVLSTSSCPPSARKKARADII